MISKNIKALRLQNGYTQKELADKLFVTSQAVSRWEKGIVEPSISTVEQMAKVFNVTTDEIIGGPSKKPEVKTDVKKVTKYKNRYIVKEGEPVLAVCEVCNRPIYKPDEIIRDSGMHNGRNSLKVVCKDCYMDNVRKIYKSNVDYGISQRKKSFIWSGVFAAVVFIALITWFALNPVIKNILPVIFMPVLIFTFSSCMFLKNNFIENLFLEVASWGFVKFPGIIFTFDLDGFIFLIGLKILFWIIGIVIGIICTTFALLICMPLSVFAYPLALKKSFKNPEKSGDI